MYTEITSVEYDKKHNTITLTGFDLGAIIDSAWDTEQEKKEYAFIFNLDEPGPKKYLAMVVTSKVKNYKTMWDAVQKLTGKAVAINDSFKA